MTSFAVTMRLLVDGPSRDDHFRRVVERYTDLEHGHSALLDCSWALTDHDDHSDVDVSVTVLAGDEIEASELAVSSVRSAIHDAGGFTPDWTGTAATDGAVAYRMTDQEVAPV